jgi:hypothetical protein
MASHPRSIHHLYDRYGSNPSMETGNTRGAAFNKPDVQDPEDRHDRRYTGDVADDWRRGGGKGGATGKPGYDHGGAWRMKDSNDWHSGHDKVEFVKPEPVAPSAHQKRRG